MFPVKPIFSLEQGRHLYLASASPRRKELLESLALPFSIIVPGNVEPSPHKNENPSAFVSRAARAKGLAALRMFNPEERGSFVLLAADTIVCLDSEILGKPKNAAHAFHMLQKLSGRTHKVLSSVYLIWNEDSSLMERAFTEATEVSFYSWPDSVLEAYAKTREPLDKAGAYAIQGRGAFLARAIDGSWTNVVGLPVSSLVKEMLSPGILVPNP